MHRIKDELVRRAVDMPFSTTRASFDNNKVPQSVVDHVWLELASNRTLVSCERQRVLCCQRHPLSVFAKWSELLGCRVPEWPYGCCKDSWYESMQGVLRGVETSQRRAPWLTIVYVKVNVARAWREAELGMHIGAWSHWNVCFAQYMHPLRDTVVQPNAPTSGAEYCKYDGDHEKGPAWVPKAYILSGHQAASVCRKLCLQVYPLAGIQFLGVHDGHGGAVLAVVKIADPQIPEC